MRAGPSASQVKNFGGERQDTEILRFQLSGNLCGKADGHGHRRYGNISFFKSLAVCLEESEAVFALVAHGRPRQQYVRKGTGQK